MILYDHRRKTNKKNKRKEDMKMGFCIAAVVSITVGVIIGNFLPVV